MEELIREEMHAALDIERFDASLRLRFVAAAHADHLRRTSGGSVRAHFMVLIPPLRGLSAVAAMLLVVVLIGMTLTGGRLFRDWSAFVHRSASSASEIDQRELGQLEARPLKLPFLAISADCPVGPTSAIEGYGAGQVSGLGVGVSSSSNDIWGTYYHANLFLKPGQHGLVLIRGRVLRNGSVIVFVGQYSAGQVIGSDKVDGKSVTQRGELVLDPSHPPQTAPLSGFFDPGATAAAYARWSVTYGVPNARDRDADCVGWQVDSLSFPTETFVTPQTMFQ